MVAIAPPVHSSFQQTRAVVRQVDEARRAFALYHSSQPHASSVDFARRLMDAFKARQDFLLH
jgi:hypothetical protein